MASVNVYTAERMQEIEDLSITSIEVVGNNLLFHHHDGTTTTVDVGAGSSASITQLIRNGTTVSAPSEDAVFDALATKPTGTLSTDGTLASNSDTKIPSEKAVKAYADQLIAAADAMVFSGTIDCSTNPNYPAADKGDTYRVSVAGKIGGAAGTTVASGALLICLVDGSPAGNQATVGANWSITQANVDGAVIGPVGAVDNRLSAFNGTSGVLIKDSGVAVSTDATLATNSDAKLPSEKAVKGYVDTATGLLIPKALFDANTILFATTDNTPAPLTVGASTFVGRKSTGAIVAMTPAEARTELAITTGPVRDTSVNLSVANAVYQGGVIIQQTDGAKLLAIGDGVTPYNNLPKYGIGDQGAYQYAYTETNLATVGATLTAWPGLTITFVSDGVFPIEVEFFCASVANDTPSAAAGTRVFAGIYEGATMIAAGWSPAAYASAGINLGEIRAADTRVWSAGSHTLLVNATRSLGGGTVTLFAGTGFRAFIRSKLAHQ